MKKLLLSAFGLIMFSTSAQSQPSQRTCGTPDLPAQYESWVNSLTPQPGKYSSGQVQSVFNIPVIVHIIHNNQAVNSISATSGNNINAAQVIDQINILNKDFNGLNADTNLIPAVFKPLLGKFQINFCLAVVNPTGGVLAEPGIDRINRQAKGWNNLPYSQTYMNNTVKPNSIWDPNRYFNIWVVPLSNTLLGYATFPNPSGTGLSGLPAPYGNATSDGVVILTSAFGSIGTAQGGPYNKGRTTTHEVGHWLGLRHIWGDANCGNDFCGDTPPAQSSNYGCPNFPLRLGVCSGNTTGEMTMNYMDYTNDACMYMFTNDQKFRAQLIMANSPIRAALITSTVCNLPTVNNDIGIALISKPTYSQTISCVNYIDPVIKVTNYGSNTLTSALFTYDVDGLNPQTYTWTGSAAPNTSFTLGLPQITGLSFGTHVFSVNVSSPNGGLDNNLNNNSNQQLFMVENNFSFNAPSSTICNGNSIVLTASGATSYSWSNGVTTSSVLLSPSVTTNYTVTGYLGLCELLKTVTVTVENDPVITLSDTLVCKGIPTIITASGANSYTWSTGGFLPSISVTITDATSYVVQASSGNGCQASKTFFVGVHQLPAISVASAPSSCSICADGSISVTVSGGTPPYNYNWTPGSITTPSASELNPGCYQIEITDANGCKAKDTACVSFELNTGIITHHANTGIKISPNPGNGIFMVQFSDNADRLIEVTDALGKVILSTKTTSQVYSLDLSRYADGIYYTRVSAGSKAEVIKLVKKE